MAAILAVSLHILIGEESPLVLVRITPGVIPGRLWKFTSVAVNNFLGCCGGDGISIRPIAHNLTYSVPCQRCGSSNSMEPTEARGRLSSLINKHHTVFAVEFNVVVFEPTSFHPKEIPKIGESCYKRARNRAQWRAGQPGRGEIMLEQSTHRWRRSQL